MCFLFLFILGYFLIPLCNIVFDLSWIMFLIKVGYAVHVHQVKLVDKAIILTDFLFGFIKQREHGIVGMLGYMVKQN